MANEIIVEGEVLDMSTFILDGNTREEAYKSFLDFEKGFSEDFRVELSFEEFCKELDLGYGNSEYVQVARLYEDEDGKIWYDNEFVR